MIARAHFQSDPCTDDQTPKQVDDNIGDPGAGDDDNGEVEAVKFSVGCYSGVQYSQGVASTDTNGRFRARSSRFRPTATLPAINPLVSLVLDV